MASKSPQAFRTIREVADWLAIEAHVLRFWESKFSQIKPVKRAGGRRYYRPADMRLVGGIKVLLHDQGLTIRGVQKVIREEGVAHVSTLSPALEEDLLVGEVIKIAAPETVTAEPLEASPSEAVAGFFDIDAMASADRPEPDAPVPAEEAAPREPVVADAPLSRAAEDAPEETAPPAIAETPVLVQKPEPRTVAAGATDEDPLAALHALITRTRSLDGARIAELAPHVNRLQALADRLAAKSRAS